MWSPSSSAGGRVWGVTSSSPCRGPIVSESRTRIHPRGVCQAVMMLFVPGSYVRPDGMLIPNGPSRKVPAPRSSRVPNTLGESKRGTQSQSTAPSGATSAPVWQLERNAYSAIGGNGDGAAALCGSRGGGRLAGVRGGLLGLGRALGLGGSHEAIQGPCQPYPDTRWLAVFGPPRRFRIRVHRWRGVEQRLEDPPGLLHAVLPCEALAVPGHCRVEEDLVGVGPSPPSWANSMSRLICSGAARSPR